MSFCANPFALRVSRCLAAGADALRFVCVTVRHIQCSRAYNSITHHHTTMPTFNIIFSQAPSWIIRYGRDLIAHVNATPAYAFARPIIVEAGIELLEQAHRFAVEWEARYI